MADRHFALTFYGYDRRRGFNKCAEIGNRWAAAYAEQQILPDSLTDLGTCLFFEQRHWHHFGDTPNGESMTYIRALLAGIRDHVSAAESEESSLRAIRSFDGRNVAPSGFRGT